MAAEADCCSFLDLTVAEGGDQLLLTIAGPREAQAVAEELALALAGGRAVSADRPTRRAGGTLFGAAGLIMALSCLAGPTILGAAAGAAIGNVLGIAAPVAVAVVAAGAVVLYRGSSGKDPAC